VEGLLDVEPQLAVKLAVGQDRRAVEGGLPDVDPEEDSAGVVVNAPLAEVRMICFAEPPTLAAANLIAAGHGDELGAEGLASTISGLEGWFFARGAHGSQLSDRAFTSLKCLYMAR
jgi:hypothetical protein